MLAEILDLATDTVIIIILMIKTTMPKPDLDLSGFPLDAWHLHPGLDRSCNGSEQSGSATSAETGGEQGVYPSCGSWGETFGLGFIPPGVLVEHWQHSFDHNGKQVQHMTEIWRFPFTLLPVAAQITGS